MPWELGQLLSAELDRRDNRFLLLLKVYISTLALWGSGFVYVAVNPPPFLLTLWASALGLGAALFVLVFRPLFSRLRLSLNPSGLFRREQHHYESLIRIVRHLGGVPKSFKLHSLPLLSAIALVGGSLILLGWEITGVARVVIVSFGGIYLVASLVAAASIASMNAERLELILSQQMRRDATPHDNLSIGSPATDRPTSSVSEAMDKVRRATALVHGAKTWLSALMIYSSVLPFGLLTLLWFQGLLSISPAKGLAVPVLGGMVVLSFLIAEIQIHLWSDDSRALLSQLLTVGQRSDSTTSDILSAYETIEVTRESLFHIGLPLAELLRIARPELQLHPTTLAPAASAEQDKKGPRDRPTRSAEGTSDSS